ncbi:hypothetical protein LCGC14_1704690 [marine sediment metagenome]|uniref:Uncharacterized protein n=1 Tax=marine sediment metagenome TaxID=412755 RepID=A0A0F9I4J4_9ZZZZ
MRELIELLKNNWVPYCGWTEYYGLELGRAMQTKAKEIGRDNFVVLNDNGWIPLTGETWDIVIGAPLAVLRLRADYVEPHRDKVFASTTDREHDSMNNIVAVTAHCKCGNVFCDDVVHGKSQAQHTEPAEDEYELCEIYEEGELLVFNYDDQQFGIGTALDMRNFAGYLSEDGEMRPASVRYFQSDSLELFDNMPIKRLRSGHITIKRPYPNSSVVLKK